MQDAEKALAIILDLVERELPEISGDAAGYGHNPSSASGGGAFPGSRLPHALHLGSLSTEEAVRQAVNRTILPEVLGRQVRR